MTSPTEAPRTAADTYEAWVQRVAAALHEDCILEWKAILVVDPKRELTQHATDTHYGKAHNLVRRLGLAEAAALPAAPAGLDVERLAAAMTRVDMGMYWNDEPRQIFDPPNMRRMAFNHAAYARDIAAAYAREEAEA